MKRIRINNDFTFAWAIERNGLPEDLSTAINMVLQVRNSAGTIQVITDYDVTGNIVSVEVTPEIANVLGRYVFILTYELPDAGLSDLERLCEIDTDAFIIVPRTAEADDAEDLLVTSDMAIGFKGDKGDAFVYDDFTPEQLEALKVKGDAFTYDDFTPEQIAELQQPATDAAADAEEVVARIEQDALAFQQAATTLINNKMSDVDTAEGLRNTAEGLRATAEGTRQSNETARVNAESDRNAAEILRLSDETTRGQNEQERITAEGLRVTAEVLRQTNTGTAITNANNAATNANTKAGLADTAANNANAKAILANDAATLANEKAGLANTAATNADNARLAIASDLALKVDKSAVKQVTGTSTTDVMSQKSVTDELGMKLDKTTIAGGGKGQVLQKKSSTDRDVEWADNSFRQMAVQRGAVYNATTGYYELNGLTDITEAQMMDIYNYTAHLINSSSWNEVFNGKTFITNYQTNNKGNLTISAMYSFQFNPNLKVFKQNDGIYLSNVISMFSNCTALCEINYIFMTGSAASTYSSMLRNCSALEICYLRGIKFNFSFAWSPLLNLASLQYLIQYRDNGTTAITITVHPTVFAKLTDNTNYPTWYAVNQDALSKYITFASA